MPCDTGRKGMSEPRYTALTHEEALDALQMCQANFLSLRDQRDELLAACKQAMATCSPYAAEMCRAAIAKVKGDEDEESL